jgi:hypothetical protein
LFAVKLIVSLLGSEPVLVLSDITVNLVALEIIHPEVNHNAIQNFRTLFPGTNSKAHDRIAVNTCHAFG